LESGLLGLRWVQPEVEEPREKWWRLLSVVRHLLQAKFELEQGQHHGPLLSWIRSLKHRGRISLASFARLTHHLHSVLVLHRLNSLDYPQMETWRHLHPTHHYRSPLPTQYKFINILIRSCKPAGLSLEARYLKELYVLKIEFQNPAQLNNF